MSPALAAAINRARASHFIPPAKAVVDIGIDLARRIIVVDEKPATPAPYILKRRYPTLDDISASVCEHFSVTLLDLESNRRSQDIVRPRQIWMYLVRKLTPTSFPAMGRYLGGRDHTTCLHGHRRIEELMLTDESVRDAVQGVTAVTVRRFNARNNIDCFDPREI